MKVLYDHQIFCSQVYGGISRYFYELIRSLPLYRVSVDVALKYSNNLYIKNLSFIKPKTFFEKYNFRGKYRLLKFLNTSVSLKKLRDKDFDIFHPTYYEPYFLRLIGNKPFVVTVHDMIHEKFPQFFPKKDVTSKNKHILCTEAKKIIAVSNNTKRDIIEVFGIPEKKIEVVYHGSSLTESQQVELLKILPRKYILFVGSRTGYKNFNNFVISVKEILKKYKDIHVICAGGGKFRDDEKNLLSKLKIENRFYQIDVNDNLLASLYKNALFFVFPSLYEGFGIPILESFANSCPLVCSSTSSFPEIAGNAALYFDPLDIDSMRFAFQEAIENREKMLKLVEKGKERLKNFSWQKTVEEHLRIYSEVVNKAFPI